jgi:hypothetical protein
MCLLALGLFMFFFADTDAPGYKGQLSILLSKKLPALASQAVKAVLGEWVHGAISNAVDYTFRQRNPILQVCMLLLMAVN